MCNKRILTVIFTISFVTVIGCKLFMENETSTLQEQQITNTPKTHALDNNDNFSADGNFLCYDTRYMVFDTNLANCKSIEKVEIASGNETVLWEPPSVSGENAAPGVAAVSYHPTQNKVIFIHGPTLDEVGERGYYNIRNRNGAIVDGKGKGQLSLVDLRDVALDRPITPGAHRGGTHRHEFSKNGKRIGFTYDDFLQKGYGRTIGYMEENLDAPQGYSHYFAIMLRPAKEGESKPGEIEKAYGDSWVDSLGSKRAFIGKVRAANGVDYENSLFVAEIPESTIITTADSGDADRYPKPPKGIIIRRLTHSTTDDGIVRGSHDGRRIAYLSNDDNGIKQVFVIPVDGSDKAEDATKRPVQVTHFDNDAGFVRWHPSDDWLFSISDGKVYASYVGSSGEMGKSILLTPADLDREALVVSPDGKLLAYNVELEYPDFSRVIDGKKEAGYLQIFILHLGDILSR